MSTLNLTDPTKPVCTRFNVAVLHIAGRINPRGWAVVPEGLAPPTLESLRRYVATYGRLAVSEDHSDKTQFADPEVNYAFRAWHDACHLATGGGFNPEGERLAHDTQRDQLRAVYGMDLELETLLRVEVLGQLDYAAVNGGEFPADQWTFTRDAMVARGFGE